MKKINLKGVVLVCLTFFVINKKAISQSKTDSLHQYVVSLKDGQFTKEVKIDKKHGLKTADVNDWQDVPTAYWKALTGFNPGKNKNGKTVTSVKVWARYDIGLNELMRGVVCAVEFTNPDNTIDNDVLLVIYHNHAKSVMLQKSIFDIQPETPVIFTQSKGITKKDCLVKISTRLRFYCYSQFTKNNITDQAFGNYKVDDISGETVPED